MYMSQYDIFYIFRLVKGEHSSVRSGGLEKQKAEEEKSTEPENILQPRTKERAKGK